MNGEQKECPICHGKTEVYSRITGYYRPVQNWNDGKLQEYHNRQEYDIQNSKLKKSVSRLVTLSGSGENMQVSIDKPEKIKYLFTTKTCPNCKAAKEYLKGESYVTIDAEENRELTLKYRVMQAPTLVVVEGEEYQKYVNASNIKKYVEDTVMSTV